MKSQVKWSERVEHFARCRAHCRKAVNDIVKKRKAGDLDYYSEKKDGGNEYLGPTYMEIRLWIQDHYRYWQENVQGRCKEDYARGFLRRETDDKGRVHVYPT